MNVYAVIQSGGKQYRVSPGDVVRVEKLDAAPGDTVEIDKVSLLETGKETHVGRPVVEGALVRAQVLEQGRGEKILVFKMKRRKGYRKTAGHRQYFTALRISEISFNGNMVGEQAEKPKEVVKKAQSPEAQPKKESPTKPQKEKARKKKAEKKTAAVAQQDKTQEEAVSTKAVEGSEPVKETEAEESMPPAVPVQAESAQPAQAVSSQTGLPAETVEEKPPVHEPKIPDEVPAAAQEPHRERAPAPVEKVPEPERPFRTEESSTPPVTIAPRGSADQEKSGVNRRLAMAVAAALLVLAIILLLWGKNSFTTSQSALVPGPGVEQPVMPDPVKAAPPVKEKITEDTAPLDKPSAPSQPPD